MSTETKFYNFSIRSEGFPLFFGEYSYKLSTINTKLYTIATMIDGSIFAVRSFAFVMKLRPMQIISALPTMVISDIIFAAEFSTLETADAKSEITP